MLTRKRTLPRRMLALGLTLAMLCPPADVLLCAARAQDNGNAAPAAAPAAPTGNTLAPSPYIASAPSQFRSILLFPIAPLDSDPTTTPVAARLDDAIKLRLDAVGAYKITSFTRFLPSVQRALDDKDLTNDDIAPPFDTGKAGRVASIVGTDAYLVGNIESYSTDQATGKVTLIVSDDLRSTATGNVVRGLSFTGTAVPASKSDDPDRVTQAAINNVAGQIASAINSGEARYNPSTAISSPHHNNNGAAVVVLALLAAVAIGIAASSHGGGGGGGSSSSSSSSGGGSTSGGPPGPPSP